MTTRRLHKIIGIILLLPFLAWSLTAVFFLVRPAYKDAYAQLAVKQYPLQEPVQLPANADWLEVKYFRSILGPHLLVRRAAGWAHVDPQSLQAVAYPNEETLRTLLNDAFTINPARYGHIQTLDGRKVATDTGVNIQVDWDTLSFSQEGSDTRWINRVYNVHYLEWTGIKVIDKVLGLAGLGLLIYMTWTGATLAFGWGRSRTAAASPSARQERN